MAEVTKRPVGWVGPSLMAIGVLHTVVMVAMFHEIYGEIVAAGLWNSVHESVEPIRAAAVWTLFFGLMLFLIGLLLPKERDPVGSSFRFGFMVLIALGIVIMPTGGFWLGLPVCIALILRG